MLREREEREEREREGEVTWKRRRVYCRGGRGARGGMNNYREIPLSLSLFW